MAKNEERRDKLKIPMLAGPSGIGKTSVIQAQRCTDELGGRINIRTHIKYFNGYSMDAQEKRYFNAVSSVYLRMVYMIFLDHNCTAMKLSQFMVKMYTELHIYSFSAADAMEAVIQLYTMIYTDCSLCRRTGAQSNTREVLSILLCVDDCHEVNQLQVDKQRGDLLSPLDDVCQSFLDVMMKGDVYLLPLLAGTNYEAAVNWSAQGAIRYIPLPPVDPLLVLQSIQSIKDFQITHTVAVRAYQLSLPRPVAEFARALASANNDGCAVEAFVAECYSSVVGDERFVVQGELMVLLEVVARAIPQIPVMDSAECAISYKHVACTAVAGRSDLTWASVRRAGLCTLEECVDDLHLTQRRKVVRIVYPVLEALTQKLQSAIEAGTVTGPVVRMLLASLQQLVALTSQEVFTLPSWQAWERFGAVYEALVINCYVYLNIKEVRLCDLFRGCVQKGCDIRVTLRPTQVIYTAHPVESPIALSDPPVTNWCNDDKYCYIVVNNFNGSGVDYVYCLPHAATGNPVLVKNQRKEDHKALGEKTLETLRDKAVCGQPLRQQVPNCSMEVIGIFSLAIDSNPSAGSLDECTVFFGRRQAAAP